MATPEKQTRNRPGSRGIALMGVVLLGLLFTTYWLAMREQDKAIQEQALQSAAGYTHVLGEFRTLYTSEVVSVIGESGGSHIQV